MAPERRTLALSRHRGRVPLHAIAGGRRERLVRARDGAVRSERVCHVLQHHAGPGHRSERLRSGGDRRAPSPVGARPLDADAALAARGDYRSAHRAAVLGRRRSARFRGPAQFASVSHPVPAGSRHRASLPHREVAAVDRRAGVQRAEFISAVRRAGQHRIEGVRHVLQLGIPSVPPAGAVRALMLIVALLLAAVVQQGPTHGSAPTRFLATGGSVLTRVVVRSVPARGVVGADPRVRPGLSDLEQALQRDPENLALAAEYRQLVIASGDFDRSVDALEQLAKRKGSGPNIYISLALAYVDKVPSSGDIRRLYLGRDAIGAATKSIERQPTVIAYYIRGLVNLYYNNFIFKRIPRGIADLQ